MNKEDRKLIQSWTKKGINDDTGWDSKHSLLITIKKEFESQVIEHALVNEVDIVEFNDTLVINECAPIWHYDVHPESLMEWVWDFFNLKPGWIERVSVEG